MGDIQRRRSVELALAAAITFFSGCRAAPSPPRSITDELSGQGINRASITRVVLRGSEGSVGPNTSATLQDAQDLDAVWNALGDSAPSDRWCACILGDAEFFTSDSPDRPVATLRVNGDEGSALETASRRARFECPAFRRWMTERLNRALAERR